MLNDCLDQHPEVELLTFKWRRALTADVDVFHAHWPEILVGGHRPLKTAVRQVLFLIMLIRMRVRGTAIVRTQHNLELPQGISRRETALLKLFERWTTLLDPAEHPHRNQRAAIHHHRPRPLPELVRPTIRGDERQPGHLAYFGLIRRYKAVDTLLAAFRQLPTDGEPVSLYIGGNPSTDELRAELVEPGRPATQESRPSSSSSATPNSSPPPPRPS